MSSIQLDAVMTYFPMERARASQVTAMEFIADAVGRNFRDIVIAAPTGSGKSGIGAAAALWAASYDIVGHKPGGYYLVTQKMLQDQLENDFPRFLPRFRTSAASLKSSSEYPCPKYGNCMAGSMATSAEKDKTSSKKCAQRVDKTCPYVLTRWRFDMAAVAVTNYPYLFTEHMYVGELEPRNMVIIDECHTLERQITGFIEVVVDKASLDNWAPACRPIPKMNHIEDFTEWLTNRYLRMCKERLDMLSENLVSCGFSNRRMQDEYNRLKNHVGRLSYAVDDMTQRGDDWVYWQELVDNEWQCTAKPLSAAPFVPSLINEMGATRIYMSAYPGPKDVFCRNLGLRPRDVAWLELDSSFPVDNRLIHMTTVGSMSRTCLDQTMPHMLKMCEAILDSHPNDKGIIHCHSYAIGQKINDYFAHSKHANRVLFATKSAERGTLFNRHRVSTEPTVMLSPSLAEGYSFDDDLARFQIIPKVPYPYLGDRQVAAKMQQDRDWYVLQTVMSVLQACGRIVRSDTDHGDTYILDSDFIRLYNENQKFFPKWFRDAFKFY